MISVKLTSFRAVVRELVVVGLVAVVLAFAFDKVITQDGKPWWEHVLAWLAVWYTYDLMKLRKKSTHNKNEIYNKRNPQE